MISLFTIRFSFTWMTWGDHFLPGQLEEIAKTFHIQAKPTLFADNSEALLKLQQVGGAQLDMVSADALWVKAYYDQGQPTKAVYHSVPPGSMSEFS